MVRQDCMIADDVRIPLYRKGFLERVMPIHRRKWIHPDNIWGYIFIAPLLIGIIIFLLAPLLRSFYLSLTTYNVLEDPVFVGFANYIELFGSDRTFRRSIVNTLIFTAGLVPGNVIIAVLVAILLNQARKGATFFRGVYFVPVITSEVVFAVVWLWMWNYNYGLFNYLLSTVNIAGQNWLGSPHWAMVAVIVTRLLNGLGMNVIIILAAIQSIPKMYYEAAEMDGAGSLRKAYHITLPELGPIIFMIAMITVIGAFKVFGTIYILTGGGPAGATNVMIMHMYNVGFKSFEYGKGSAIGVVIFAMIMAITLMQWLLRKKMVQQEE